MSRKGVKKRMKHLVLGHHGEVGSAIYKLLKNHADYIVHGIDIVETTFKNKNIKFDTIHVCIPFLPEDEFYRTVKDVLTYGKKEVILIIHSTVKPGTTNSLNEFCKNVVYSPVRGRHAEGLIHGLKTYQKFYMSENNEILSIVEQIFDRMNIPSKAISGNPTSLEYAKLFNTTWHYMNVVFAEEVYTMAEEKELDLEVISSFIDSTMDRKIYPYAQAVGNKKNDHCLDPNAHLLSQEGSSFAAFLISRNYEFYKKYGNEQKRIK
ncbi:MAG: hypothetical protein EAX86_04495 [Candidatus Heimdallarchaeota archaeon]|nr:hypothetical protein [Candidatus Heimdallarchaeota archaeon]